MRFQNAHISFPISQMALWYKKLNLALRNGKWESNEDSHDWKFTLGRNECSRLIPVFGRIECRVATQPTSPPPPLPEKLTYSEHARCTHFEGWAAARAGFLELSVNSFCQVLVTSRWFSLKATQQLAQTCKSEYNENSAQIRLPNVHIHRVGIGGLDALAFKNP